MLPSAPSLNSLTPSFNPANPPLSVTPDVRSKSMPGMPPIANPSEIGLNSDDLARQVGIDVEMESPPSLSDEKKKY